MIPKYLVIAPSLFLAFTAMAQEDAPKPKVSSEPLTGEQVAVYRAVLQDYLKDSTGTLNLAHTTEPIGQSARFFNGGCPKISSSQATSGSGTVVHHLDPSVTLNLKLTLVDPDRQEEKIRNGDPAILAKRVIDDRENVPTTQIDNAIEQAFKNGLFTLSEIVFNRQHNRALASYSFVCGALCGHGSVLVLKKTGERWKVHKTCTEWVS